MDSDEIEITEHALNAQKAMEQRDEIYLRVRIVRLIMSFIN